MPIENLLGPAKVSADQNYQRLLEFMEQSLQFYEKLNWLRDELVSFPGKTFVILQISSFSLKFFGYFCVGLSPGNVQKGGLCPFVCSHWMRPELLHNIESHGWTPFEVLISKIEHVGGLQILQNLIILILQKCFTSTAYQFYYFLTVLHWCPRKA